MRNISTLSRNSINIELIRKHDLENFIEIFTVLDKYVTVKTFFAEVYSIINVMIT